MATVSELFDPWVFFAERRSGIPVMRKSWPVDGRPLHAVRPGVRLESSGSDDSARPSDRRSTARYLHAAPARS
ncbi:hypothetical protein CA601_10170 [Paraburkholderia hospita]|nr:hypothetical protein CA602_18610 [Paraburkholderia hospita]OUL93332.1 hypothetical protein CA601_10170 [Paraburkholderia hospita]OUL97348.1 hypothetical protein CA603_03015 [Paraburkholderia hospita]